MNKFSLVSVLAILAAAIVFAMPLLQEPAESVDQVPAHQLRSERIVDLPEDGDLWQLVLVYTDKARNGDDRELAAMFATTPRLQSLVAQTKVYEYPPEHWWVKQHLGDN